MTVLPPIHSSALHPIEFIPAHQDADTHQRQRTAQLRKEEQAHDRRASEIQAAVNAGDLDEAAHQEALGVLDAARAHTQASWGVLERNLEFMRRQFPTPQVFLISVPTSVEREQINSRLISLGLQQVTQEMIRATMIEELFHQDWSLPGEEISSEINQARAEDNANFLDSVWLRQQAHDEAIRQWHEQEVERMVDELEGAPSRPRADVPVKIIGIREQSRMQILIDRMMTTSQRLRDLAASNMDFGRRNAVLLVRMHLIGVEGFTPAIPLERGRHTRALSEDAVLALREQVDDTSWNQLVSYIDQLYRLDGGEEKNSDSPPEKPSLPGGSTEPSASPATNAGSSTASPSTPAPAVESEMTTDKSSGSTSDSSTALAPTPANDSQTAEG